MGNDQKRYAVIIGVSEYEEGIHPLPCAKEDAIRLQSILQEKPGFSTDRIYLLANDLDHETNEQNNSPTRANILHKLQYVCNAAGPEDVILLYFAGHGTEMSKKPYLLASDTKMDVLQKTAVDVNEINEMLEQANARCVIRIFDACRSPFGEGRSVLARMASGFEEAVLKAVTGWASFSSCSSGEVAHDLPEFDQGVFTYYLCQGLKGKASNTEGNVTLESLVDYVKTSVGNWCDRQTLRQTPHFQTDISGSLVFATSVPKPVESATFPNDPFAELRSGLEEHLSRSAGDTRRLTFTSQQELQEISSVVHECLKEQLARLSLPSLNIDLADGMPLQNVDQTNLNRLRKDMDSCGVRSEFTNTTVAFRINFQSEELLLPNTTLDVVVVQFKFFYWIWYCHVCPQQQLQGIFLPDPALTKGFFTFKPTAMRDKLKVDHNLSVMFSRVSSEIVLWATQLGGYVESRMEPLRKMGPVVE